MSDVSVSLGVTGKDAVLGAFSQVGQAGQKMGETFGSIAGKLAGLAAGYVSISGAIGSFNAVMARGGQLADFSDQTGIATGKLVILGRAFENNGMKAEDLGSVINKMQKTLVAAGDEGSAAADKIGRLGLKVSDLQAMTPDQQFETIAKAIAKIQDPTERAGAAMEIFGKAGGRTLALFADFDGAVSQAQSEVGSFADNMEKNARSFDAIGDGIGAIGDKFMEFTAGVLGDSIPALETLVNYFKSVDATAFGASFSESLSRGVDIALSIFTNPGNLFLAFGDALTVALKTGGNALMNSLVFVFDWAKNYASELLPGIAGLLEATLKAAIGPVITFFTGKLADVFSDLGALIPGTLGKSLSEAGDRLKAASEESAEIAQEGLANAWGKIASAAEKATEQTSLQREDWLNAAGSAADLREHLTIAEESGAEVRTAMQETLDHAKLITQEAAAWEKATNRMADNFSGATDSFKAFTSGDTEAIGLSAMSGLNVPQGGGVGPVANESDRRSAAASNRSMREKATSGRATDPLKDAMQDLLLPSDYVNQSNRNIPGTQATWDQIQQRMETRANQQVQKDLSYYTGGDQNASKSQAIDDLFRKYQADGVGGTPSELRTKAAADYESLVNSKLGGTGGTGSGNGGSGGAGGAPGSETPKSDPMTKVLGEIRDFVKTITNDRLPIQVLA
jgi:hypothetical protein